MLQLHKNEAQYTVPSSVRWAIYDAGKRLNIYPSEKELQKARIALSRYLGTKPETLLFVDGIDGALDLFCKIYPQMRFCHFDTDFFGYPARFDLNRVRRKTLHHPQVPGRCPKGIKVEKNDFVVYSSPNNPLGSILPESLQKYFNFAAGVVLQDQTYREFATKVPKLDTTKKKRFIFCSLSKSFAMAGLRLGVIIGHPASIKDLENHNRYAQLSTLALAAVKQAAHHKDYYVEKINQVKEMRDKVINVLEDNGYLPIKSETNFVTFTSPFQHNIHHLLRNRGVLARSCSDMGLSDHIRLTIPSQNHLPFLLQALQSLHDITIAG